MKTNSEIAHILKLIGEYLVLEEGDTSFKTRAYARAAEIVSDLATSLSDIYKKDGRKGLQKIAGIGLALSEKIEELVTTGSLQYFEDLKKRIPVDVENLTAVDSLGPKRILVLYRELGVSNLQQLETAARQGKIEQLEGFGKKSSEKILQSIAFVSTTNNRRFLGEIRPFLDDLIKRFRNHPDVEKAVLAGSARRAKETIGDIDILVVSKKPKTVMDFLIQMPEIGHVYGSGETKTMVRLKDGLDLDLRVVAKDSYGAALQYFTGSKDHNVAIREIARKKNLTLNEYGLSKGTAAKKGAVVASKTEKDIYQSLGLEYIEPELRENTGEIEASQKKKLPRLIPYGSLQGDLQIQTNWTDGKNPLEQMAQAAIEIGLSYILITDHTKSLRVAGGLNEARIIEQGKEIDALNKKLKKAGQNFTLLKGVECDILKDGSLDISDKVLKTLDIVGVSVHSFFDLSEEEQTRRIIQAISNPNADILFHPTGRRIGKREPYRVKMDELIAAAKKTKTVLEINSMPERSDLQPEYIRQCVKAGVKMSISSDAHNQKHLNFLEYGVSQARRGWARKQDIINAWPLAKMRTMLK